MRSYDQIAFSGLRDAYITHQRFADAEALMQRQPTNAASSALLQAAGGKLDIISDLHGCWEDTVLLLARLGWGIDAPEGPHGPLVPFHADPQRRLALLGDLVTRGPDGMACLRFALGLSRSGRGTVLLGNHDWQLLAVSRHACFPPLPSGHANADLAALAQHPLRDAIWAMLHTLPEQVAFHDTNWGQVVLVHAAPAALPGLPSWVLPTTPSIQASYAHLYGHQHWEDGRVQQLDWRTHHHKDHWVVFGHQPFDQPTVMGKTIGLDLGQSLGGSMAALAWDRFDPMAIASCTVTTGPGLPPLSARARWVA